MSEKIKVKDIGITMTELANAVDALLTPNKPDAVKEHTIILGRVFDKDYHHMIIKAAKDDPMNVDRMITGIKNDLAFNASFKKLFSGPPLKTPTKRPWLILAGTVVLWLSLWLLYGQFVIHDGWSFFVMMFNDLFN